jgi:hypothetical protein
MDAYFPKAIAERIVEVWQKTIIFSISESYAFSKACQHLPKNKDKHESSKSKKKLLAFILKPRHSISTIDVQS